MNKRSSASTLCRWIIVIVFFLLLCAAMLGGETPPVPAVAEKIVVTATAAAEPKVPVDVSDTTITVTVTVVVDDHFLVIRCYGSKSKTLWRDDAAVVDGPIDVFYPEVWGEMQFLKEDSGKHLILFSNREYPKEGSLSLWVNLERPLNNLDEEEKRYVLPELNKVFGSSRSKNLTFRQRCCQPVRWTPADSNRLQELDGRGR